MSYNPMNKKLGTWIAKYTLGKRSLNVRISCLCLTFQLSQISFNIKLMNQIKLRLPHLLRVGGGYQL